MSWTTPTSRSTGFLFTAAVYDADVVDNLIALRAGAIALSSQAAGDLVTASSTTQFSRLAKGTAFQQLRMKSDASGLEYFTETGATEYNAGNTGTAITINFATNGFAQKATRNGNCTITLTAPAVATTVVLKLVHDGSGTAFTVAWSPTVKWPNGIAPTFTNSAGAIDIVTLYWDGAAWFGVVQTAFA